LFTDDYVTLKEKWTVQWGGGGGGVGVGLSKTMAQLRRSPSLSSNRHEPTFLEPPMTDPQKETSQKFKGPGSRGPCLWERSREPHQLPSGEGQPFSEDRKFFG